MTITVSVRGVLADRIPGGPMTFTGDEVTVGALLDHLGLARTGHVVVVNGTAVRAARRLRDGDRVQVHSQQAGG